MVHPTDVLPGGSPKHRALAYRLHRPCCPTPSAPLGCPTRRSQSLEPAALPDVSLPAIAVRPLINTASGTVRLGSMSVPGVRRGKAALSSGCKPHPAIAPAGSNRSSHGGNE